MVSVIVPAYNVERYIEACLGSVLAQTDSNWELIVVDDGSTDGTPAICDRFAAMDARIRCEHSSNRGVAIARNTALDLARGEFILFLDGDDALEPEAISHLLSAMEADVDIACCGFTGFSDESGLNVRRSFFPENLDARSMAEKEPLFLQLHDGHLGQPPGKTYTAIGVPWGKLYRASLIRENALRFPPMRLFEDNIFNMYAFTFARRIVYRSEYLYRYRVDHCTSYKLSPEARLSTLEARDAYYKRFGDSATAAMRRERYREKLRDLGASCKYYATTLPNRAAAIAIRELCGRPAYANMLIERAPCALPLRYRLLCALLRARLWRAAAAISALRGDK